MLGVGASASEERKGIIAMVAIKAIDAKPGTKVMFEGDVYNVVTRDHHKPGKGGAFVRYKLKSLTSGKVVDKTVRSEVSVERADVETKSMQYLYPDVDDFVFMDLTTYDQLTIAGDMLGDQAKFMIENAEITVTLWEGNPIGIELPPKMIFTIVETIDAVKGNTATNVTKEATTDTGFIVNVPLFIKEGEKIVVSTETGDYVERKN